MKHRPGHQPVSPRLLAAYIDGDVAPSEAAAVERALAESPVLRRRADGLRHIKDVLSSPIHALESVDLTARLKAAVEREQHQAPADDKAEPPGAIRAPFALSPRRGWRFGLTGTATLAACAALAAVVLMTRVPLQEEFRAKSAATGDPTEAAGATMAARWAGISVFHVGEKEKPIRLGSHLPFGHGLLFSYTNAGAAPFDFLMVLAVDATHEVRWFFPAYEEPGSNPGSIPIEEGRVQVPLTELLHHDLPRGRLVVRAIFSRHPLHVLEVEAWLRGRPDGAPLPWTDAYQQIIVTAVD